MEFSVLVKDYNEEWITDAYVEKIMRCQSEGLINSLELGGNLFDIQEDFLFFAQDEFNREDAQKLIELSYFYDVTTHTVKQPDRVLFKFNEENGENHTLITFI